MYHRWPSTSYIESTIGQGTLKNFSNEIKQSMVQLAPPLTPLVFSCFLHFLSSKSFCFLIRPFLPSFPQTKKKMSTFKSNNGTKPDLFVKVQRNVLSSDASLTCVNICCGLSRWAKRGPLYSRSSFWQFCAKVIKVLISVNKPNMLKNPLKRITFLELD